MSFRALGLDANILKAVKEAGYTEPTPIQAAAIPQILAGHDLIGIAQIGTGKNGRVCAADSCETGRQHGRWRQLRHPRPGGGAARELAAQIQENLRAYAKHLPLRAASVFGGVGEHAQIQALRCTLRIMSTALAARAARTPWATPLSL